jgi:hypothetical protein
LASSLYFLQGTFEKIHLQRLVGHKSLQSVDLSAQLTFAGVRRWWLAVLDRLQLIAPLVQQAPVYAEFLGERADVLAAS